MGLKLKITPETIEEDFARIAHELMNDWVLTVNKTYYRITEIEFYYDHIDKTLDNTIKDPYTHRHEQQKKSGTWYFHGSGLDLTCGDENNYGGILIRGLYKFDSTREKKFNHISGPINSVTEILSSFGRCEKKQMEFGFEHMTKLPLLDFDKRDLIKAPRVGLNPNINTIAHQKLFRFLIYPKETNRDKSIIIESLVAQKLMTKEEAKKLVYK